MIKVIKKRKNPNLKGEEFIDDHFIELLFESVNLNRPWQFQEAMTYKNIGFNKCDDCSEEGDSHYYTDCDCENYIDDYNIPIHRLNTTSIELINAVKKQLKYLSRPLLIKMRIKLWNSSSPHILWEDRKKLIDHIDLLLEKND